METVVPPPVLGPGSPVCGKPPQGEELQGSGRSCRDQGSCKGKWGRCDVIDVVQSRSSGRCAVKGFRPGGAGGLE